MNCKEIERFLVAMQKKISIRGTFASRVNPKKNYFFFFLGGGVQGRVGGEGWEGGGGVRVDVNREVKLL